MVRNETLEAELLQVDIDFDIVDEILEPNGETKTLTKTCCPIDLYGAMYECTVCSRLCSKA